MKYAPTIFNRLGLLLLALAVFNILGGCKSVRSSSSTTRTLTSDSLTVSQSADTLNIASKAIKIEADTSTLEADERGAVEIQYDTVGRPVYIAWSRNLYLTDSARKWGLYDFGATGVAASTGSTRARAENIDSQNSANETTEVRTPSIEARISAVLIGGLLLCFLWCLFQDVVLPWIKRKIK